MKVIILAGGMGTRLGQQTDSIPKPMVTIGGKPILWHIMKIYSNYGYNDFIISLGYKADIIKEYFRNYNIYNNDFSINLRTRAITEINNHDEKDWNITLIDTGVDTLKGARIKRLESHLDDINMVTYGDGIADINIEDLVKYHKSHKRTVTISGVHPPARFGEINDRDGKLTLFEEKPQSSVGLINGGFMVFNKNMLNYLSVDKLCDFEKGPLEKLASENEVMVYKHLGLWECVDHGRDLDHLNQLWNEGRAFWKIW
jgi:glucose-1-phosphate cytidylyltransferase